MLLPAHEYYAVLRRDYAFTLPRGCPEDIVEWNFRKESGDEAAEALKRAGFARVDLVWEHDTFALFLAEAH